MYTNNSPVDLNSTPVVTPAANELYSSSTPLAFSMAVLVQPYNRAEEKKKVY